MSRKIFLAVALLLTTFTPVAAMTLPESQAILERALTLLEHRRWNDARHEFTRLQEITSPEQVSLKQQIDFGLTVCAVELGVGDSEQRMLDYLKPDFVHVLVGGRIVKNGDASLGYAIEERGFDWIKNEITA